MHKVIIIIIIIIMYTNYYLLLFSFPYDVLKEWVECFFYLRKFYLKNVSLRCIFGELWRDARSE
jgi:hypothetical protein